MKKRYLRKPIEVVLTIITMLQFMFFAMLDDFDLSALPILIAAFAVMLFNIYILKKYGRGVLLENDNETQLQ